jgi:AraC-like DNA-binding protein
MTLTLTYSGWDELWDLANPQSASAGRDDFETLYRLPPELGSGLTRRFDLAPGMSLCLSDWDCQQEWAVRMPDHDHPIQVVLLLSGCSETEIHPILDKTRAYFSGSGISPGYKEQHVAGQHLMSIDIELEPALLEATFGEMPSSIKSMLYKGEDWKAAVYPTVTPAMRSLAQQIWDAPYCGVAQRMYLHGKAWELLAMQIDLLMADQAASELVVTLKPDTIARLHYAKEILTQQLENPPLLTDLARQVGVSDRTLLRGFRQLFGTTPMGYLTQQRMRQARMLLLEGTWTVAEVARRVGYGHLGHFATAFRRQFGMNPRQCLKRSS